MGEQSVSETRLGNFFQNRKIFPFRKESIFPFWKNHPLLKDPKFKLLLCMSLVFRASRNNVFSFGNHIFEFFTKDFENLSSSFFLFSKICCQVLSSARGCIYSFHSGSFIQTFSTRCQVIMVVPFHMKKDFDIKS